MPQLRDARESDADAIVAIYAPFVRDTAVTFDVAAPSAAEYARKIRETLAVTPWLVAEIDGRVVGYAYASGHRARQAYQWSVEVSAYVQAEGRRQGVARLLYKELFD